MVKDLTSYEALRDAAFKHVFLPLRPIPWLREGEHLKVFVKGEGIRLTDIKGKVYIDGAAAWQYGNVGHGRTEIGDAIRDQIADLVVVATEFVNIPKVKLAVKLAEITPGNLSKVAFCNSGSEAVETAQKIAGRVRQPIITAVTIRLSHMPRHRREGLEISPKVPVSSLYAHRAPRHTAV